MCTLCCGDVCTFGLEPSQAFPVSAGTGSSAQPLAVTVPDLGSEEWSALSYSGLKWSGNTLTYGFADSGNDYQNSYTPYNEPDHFLSFSEDGKDILRAAFATWNAAVAVDIVEAASGTTALMQVGGSTVPPTAWAYTPANASYGGDIWFGLDTPFFNKLLATDQPAYLGSYEFLVGMHEMGHALGLKHPHDNPNILPEDSDGLEYTVMSYRSVPGGGLGYKLQRDSYPQSLMMLDLAVIQDLYGANYDTLSGDTLYVFTPDSGEMFVDGVASSDPTSNRILRTLWDGDGEDTIDLSAYATDLEIDLTPGQGIDLDVNGTAQKAKMDRTNDIYAQKHIYMSLLHQDDTRSLIENAIGGTGDDTFIGNAANNRFEGGLGADTFILAGGANIVQGSLAGLDGDTIADFDPTQDRLIVEDGTAQAALVVFDPTTGLLRIDGNGDGIEEATLELSDLDLTAPLSVEIDGADIVAVMAPGPAISAAQMAVGTTTVDHDWTTISFGIVIEDARVIIGPPSRNGSDAGVMRVRNVTETGFQMQFDEWDYLNGSHTTETVSWIAGPSGSWTLDSGETLSFGQLELTDSLPGSVALDGLDAPAVFTQVTSRNDSAAVTTRIASVTDDGFSVLMQEEEAGDDVHATETVDWLAISDDDASTGLRLQTSIVQDSFTSYNFTPVAGEVALLAAQQSMYGGHPAALRHDSLDSGSVRLTLEEEQSADAETRHSDEDLAFVALQTGLYDLYI